jgi:hypothetical protein
MAGNAIGLQMVRLNLEDGFCLLQSVITAVFDDVLGC